MYALFQLAVSTDGGDTWTETGSELIPPGGNSSPITIPDDAPCGMILRITILYEDETFDIIYYPVAC